MVLKTKMADISLVSRVRTEALPGGRSHVAHLNFKTSRVGVYKCLSLIVGFAITVAIWPREVVSCRDVILHAVATFWAMLVIGIYPGRASELGKIIAKNMARTVRRQLEGQHLQFGEYLRS